MTVWIHTPNLVTGFYLSQHESKEY